MLAKVSNKEILTDVSEGTFKPIHGRGGRTDDKNTINIDENDGILQPKLWPKSISDAMDRAAANIEAVDKKFKVSDDVEKRLGTGNVRRATVERNEASKEYLSGDDRRFLAFTLNAQPLIREAHCGKDLPGFASGKPTWLDNAIPSTLGLIGGLSQYINAAGQELNSPNIYAANQYERYGLSTLSQLRDNPYQQLRAMQDAERRNRYNISQAGGLTGAQRYFANVAGDIGMQRNYADILNRSNQQNNAYRAQWANAAMTAGQANAARMLQANQYRDEAYAKAHAAREQQKQMGMFNMLNQVQQYYANEFKRKQFNNMYDLYAADVNSRTPNYRYETIPTIPSGMLKEPPTINLAPSFNFPKKIKIR